MSDAPEQSTKKIPASRDPGQHEPGTLPWLMAIMRRLLGPDGCPWDREQTLDSIKRFLLEEAYEVVDAIDEGDRAHQCEEMGDVLYILAFQAELAGLEMEQVIRGAGEKLIRRHPHVFGEVKVDGTGQVLANWEKIKKEEKAERGDRKKRLLEGLPLAMPALQRAHRLTERAAKVGFDWPEAAGARAKVDEELGEADEAVASGEPGAMSHELGDLLFAVVNWARKLDLEPEELLRQANSRFCQRFAHVEDAVEASGRELGDVGLQELDGLWDESKRG